MLTDGETDNIILQNYWDCICAGKLKPLNYREAVDILITS